MSARRRPSSYRPLPSRSAAAWLWVDMLTKLHPIGQLFLLLLAATVVVFLIAWWPFVLAAAVCWLALRWWRRRPPRGRIPFGGRLSLIEWVAVRVIEVCEGVLRRHNAKRRVKYRQ